MINLNRDSDSAIIVLHEIYGVNQHMKGICQSLSEYNFDVFCPNLLERSDPFDYSDEEAAYRHFMNQVGFDHASAKIKTMVQNVRENYQRLFIVGFSVGATVAWMCSEEENIDGIVGYYGSRIRDYLGMTPQMPVMLFFPEEEKSFNVNRLISALANNKKIKTHQLVGQHGFSDPYSLKYNEQSSQTAFREMIKFLKGH